MKIVNHRLEKAGSSFDVAFQASPNHGGTMRPRFLVMHYTAGLSASSSISWLCNPVARASAHFVVDRRTGAITQLVPCNKVAWHAGLSEWQGVQGLNAHSIGIELDNAGLLKRQGGRWVHWAGKQIPEAEVIEAAHRKGGEVQGWHTYTEVQIEAALELAVALHAAYGFEDILGHEDISWPRKTDPGPAFPLASLAGRVLGRQ